MNVETIYSLIDIRGHVQDLIDELDDNLDDYSKGMEKIIRNRSAWKKEKIVRKIRQLSYTMTANYIDVVETLKKCNDYLYMSNYQTNKGEGYINNIKVDVEELKDIRRRVKNLHIDEIKKLYRKQDSYKIKRNQFAHKMNEFIPVSLFENRDQIVQMLASYLNILDKIAVKNEVKLMEKRNAFIESGLKTMLALQTKDKAAHPMMLRVRLNL